MGTPPVPHRRRTSSGSSAGSGTFGTSPPASSNPWTVSPPPGGRSVPWPVVSPRSSPLRHSRSGRFTPPSLPPILGSPNQWGVQVNILFVWWKKKCKKSSCILGLCYYKLYIKCFTYVKFTTTKNIYLQYFIFYYIGSCSFCAYNISGRRG